MKVVRRIAWLTVAALVAGGFALYWLERPYQGFKDETFVEIPRGSSAEAIADLLANAGAIRNRWGFLAARAIERGRVLQAGEYRFNHPATPFEVFDRIARGDIFYYTLTVPEGKNIFDISTLAGSLGLFSAGEFLTEARNPAMIADLDPDARTLEGYLFPNTYRLSRSATPQTLCRLMTNKFREVWGGLSGGDEAARPKVHDAVTLASLVEREGKVAEDRPLIAAVFENRLRFGMKLDCDPSTIYAALLDNRYRGTIYRSDLESDNPYNTYRHAGLPPGPIANPGIASLKAALHPAESDALYFVLRPDGSGRHEFSSSIAAHNAATARYRRGQR